MLSIYCTKFMRASTPNYTFHPHKIVLAFCAFFVVFVVVAKFGHSFNFSIYCVLYCVLLFHDDVLCLFTAVDCGPVPTLLHASTEGPYSTEYTGRSPIFRCHKGFWFSRGVYTSSMSCLADGRWTDDVTGCESKGTDLQANIIRCRYWAWGGGVKHQ